MISAWLFVLGLVGLQPADRTAIVTGVECIAAPGLPGPLVVYGPEAFAVVAGRSGQGQEAVVAAGPLGKGRVVAFGHDGYLGAETLGVADTGRLFLQSLAWLSREKAPVVAVLEQPGLVRWLEGQGISARNVAKADLGSLGGSTTVLVTSAWSATPETHASILRFVEGGGGLLTAGLGWGWLQLNPGKTVADIPIVPVTQRAGILWADGSLDRTSADGYRVEPQLPDLNATRALDQTQGPNRERNQAVRLISRAIATLPADDTILRPKLVALRGSEPVIPTDAKPVGYDDPSRRIALTLDLLELRDTPIAKIRAHPASVDFPGPVPPDAVRQANLAITLPAQHHGWQSTGLYVPPGEPVTVRIPTSAVAAGLRAVVGCHTDTLWHLESWKRAPEIARSFALNQQTTTIASPFGGLLYIDVPEQAKAERIVNVSGAVRATRFVRGQTSAADWATERRYPAPWAELEGERVVLSLPASVVQQLDDPTELVEFWDTVADLCADLATWPRERSRKERFVTDRQISAGYMHAGYPLMTGMDVAEVFVDLPRIKADGHGGVWGFFHEIGHNHQSDLWTFEGTGEVTVNLFTLYVYDKLLGMPVTQARGTLFKPEAIGERYVKFRDEDGLSHDKWKNDPFLALLMYVQLIEAFGWDAYKKVFAEYRALPRDQQPRSQQDRRDEWMARFSRTVGRNLGPFFTAWGIPITDRARQSVSDLPTWMPDNFPPK
ncbi:MAG: M60 family metallopeptidase [Fimbriimonadaceae bacterium]